jgi:glycosyltransferase involved in cell wall biosynthesis
MKITGKSILLISPESWEHIFVSKHHYAINLGRRGNNVYFLNPPSLKKEVAWTGYTNVWKVNYTGFPVGLRFFPKFLQKQIIKKTLKKLESLCSVRFEVIWSFDNSVFYDFSAFSADLLKISHIVDMNQDFQTRIAAKTADICFGVSSPIVNKLRRYNKNTFFINHGCNDLAGKKIVSLPGNNRTKAVYAGNLNIRYLDWYLFKEVITKNKDIDFIFAGPWEEGELKKSLASCSNVWYLGQLHAEELRSYYAAADVLLLLYKVDEFPEQLSNSHKMMEYLASGKMIVATYTKEYRELITEGLLLMTKDKKEFSQLLLAAVQNLEYWNSIEKQEKRKAYALDNTYEKQINRIESLINAFL